MEENKMNEEETEILAATITIGVVFLGAVLFPITIPYLLYKRQKGNKGFGK